MDKRPVYAVMILAAGASRRMGQPKQLLPVDGIPLLRRTVQTAIDAKLGPTWVVLGANAEAIRPTLAGLTVQVVINDAWAEGMGASIRTGMAAIDGESRALDGVVIALGDQPEISAAHLGGLIRMMTAAGKSIVASRFAGMVLPPVLFGPEHFPTLRALRGDTGARALLEDRPDQIVAVDTRDLGDLDTPEDYAAFLKRRT
jgi:molybdenum cofactor cytidylyltransferase